MSDQVTPVLPGDHSTGRRVAVTVAMLIALIGTAIPVTLAWQASLSGANASDTEEVGVNRLGAATLDVEVGPGGSDATDAALRAENLAPGDRVTGEIGIRNEGSLPLRYAVTATTDGSPLADWLLFDLWTSTGSCADGIGAAREILRSNVVLAATQVLLIGDPSIGVQDGDRALAPGSAEVVCIGAHLPLEASNDVQGLTLGFDLVVDAEHDLDAQATLDGPASTPDSERTPASATDGEPS